VGEMSAKSAMAVLLRSSSVFMLIIDDTECTTVYRAPPKRTA